MKDFYRWKGAETKKLYQAKKADWLLQGHFPLGTAGVYQADYLTSADVSGWFKIPSPGEPKLSLSLDLVTWGLAF